MSYLRPRNVLRGITPTASGWGVSPANLGNCTDGDPSTYAGTGTRTLAAAGNIGELRFDLGSAKNILVAAKISLAFPKRIDAFIEQGSDAITYVTNKQEVAQVSNTSGTILTTMFATVFSEWFRLRFYGYDIGTASVDIYEVVGFELNLEK